MLRKLRRRAIKLAKAAVLVAGRYIPAVRRWFRKASAWRRARFYAKMCRQSSVQNNLVIFECYAGRAYTCSPRAIYQAMLADENCADFELVWVFRGKLSRALQAQFALPDPDVDMQEPIPAAYEMPLERIFGEEALAELSHARLVRYGSREYYELHARAKYWIANYILPTHLKPRDGQIYLQTWHGTPLKRLGCDLSFDVQNAKFEVDEIHTRYTAEGERITHLISPSPFATEKLSTAFDLASVEGAQKLLEVGYPRNDFLAQVTPERIASIKQRLGLPEDKKAILYSPTWRDDQHVPQIGYTYKTEVDFDRLRSELGDEYVILFRAHYLVANDFDFDYFRGFVYDVSYVSDINDLYVVSEVLITDYSSVFFDFSNLGRPMIFYMYDLERYAEDLRGFYLDLSELPGPIVRTEDELLSAIQAAGKPGGFDYGALRRFAGRFNPLDDGHAAERAIEHVTGVGRGGSSPEARRAG